MDILKNLEYCPPNVTIYDIWLNHGLSHCFFDTVGSSLIAAFIVIFGSLQFIMYRRYATPIEDLSQISTSKLYYLQLFLMSLLPSLSVLRFILESFVFPDAHLYGYTVIFETSINIQSWTNENSTFVDCCNDIILYIICILNMFGAKRTLLLITIDTNERPWFSFARLLVNGFYQWKLFDNELGKGGLVESCVCDITW